MIKESELIENKEVRENYISRIDVLEKVKQLLLLPDVNMATTQQVADFYDVDIEAIKYHIKNNRDELELDGYMVWKASDFKTNNMSELKIIVNRGSFEVEFTNGQKETFAPRGVGLFPRKAILRIGILLRDSEIASKVREKLSNYPYLYNYFLFSTKLSFKKHENNLYAYLYYSFGKENIKRQVKCKNYLIDFVLYEKIAIECDENGHSGYNFQEELIRENCIKNKGYILIRYNPHKQKPYELIKNISINM